MDLGLRGKKAIVMGGSRGIGRSIALTLAAEGADVAICARGEGALRQTEAELQAHGGMVYAAPCDASSPEALSRFMDDAHQHLGGVQVLVNNISAFAMSDDETGWHDSLNVDLMAGVRATWKAVPWMEAAGGGSIVHIASVAGMEATWRATYAAAKAAMISHARTLSVELAPKKIRINSVAPGSIEFPGGRWEGVRNTDPERFGRIVGNIPWGRMGSAQEVADAVVYLASDRASWVTGVCLRVDGGQYKANL